MLAAALSLLVTGDYHPALRATLGEEDSPLVVALLAWRRSLLAGVAQEARTPLC